MLAYANAQPAKADRRDRDDLRSGPGKEPGGDGRFNLRRLGEGDVDAYEKALNRH